MSARRSTARPRACSGAMYAAVPMIMPIWVARAVNVGELLESWGPEVPESIAFASPKSSTLTVPSSRTLMFCGFRSRWTMPCSCAASSASMIWRAMAIASARGNPPDGGRVFRPGVFAGPEGPASEERDPASEDRISSDRSRPSTSSMTRARETTSEVGPAPLTPRPTSEVVSSIP